MSAGALSRLVRLTRCTGSGRRWIQPNHTSGHRRCPDCYRPAGRIEPDGETDRVPPHSPSPAGN